MKKWEAHAKAQAMKRYKARKFIFSLLTKSAARALLLWYVFESECPKRQRARVRACVRVPVGMNAGVHVLLLPFTAPLRIRACAREHDVRT